MHVSLTRCNYVNTYPVCCVFLVAPSTEFSLGLHFGLVFTHLSFVFWQCSNEYETMNETVILTLSSDSLIIHFCPSTNTKYRKQYTAKEKFSLISGFCHSLFQTVNLNLFLALFWFCLITKLASVIINKGIVNPKLEFHTSSTQHDVNGGSGVISYPTQHSGVSEQLYERWVSHSCSLHK